MPTIATAPADRQPRRHPAAPAAEMLALDKIRTDGGTQPRAALHPSWVEEYAHDMMAGAALPPVVVFYDGTDHWLADGFHRYHAAAALKRGEIAADVRQGTSRDAILFSVGANAQHGMRRTNDDKRRAVRTLLDDAEWSGWSDRKIAEKCGVDHKTVASLRPRSAPVSGEVPQMGQARKVERGGKTYEMNTAGINAGREPRESEPAEVVRPDPKKQAAFSLSAAVGGRLYDLEKLLDANSPTAVVEAERTSPLGDPARRRADVHRVIARLEGLAETFVATEAPSVKAEPVNPDRGSEDFFNPTLNVIAIVAESYGHTTRYKTRRALAELATQVDPGELADLGRKATHLAKWFGWLAVGLSDAERQRREP